MNGQRSVWLGRLSDPKIKQTMETIHKIKVEDKTRIKHIHFKHPELVNNKAIGLIKAEYKALLEAQGELYEAREKVRKLEKKYSKLEQEWKAKQELFDIEYESYEKEVRTQTSYMTINGKTVYDCNSRR